MLLDPRLRALIINLSVDILGLELSISYNWFFLFTGGPSSIAV
jgi:hypothetical protein